jgi:O-antigen ligase
LLAALAGTFSRGTFLVGAPATVGVLFISAYAIGLRVNRRLLWGAAGVAAAAVLFVAAFSGTERVRGALDPSPGGTLHLRLRLWESAVRMGLDHFVGGVGPDNFLGHYRDIYVQRDAVTERFLNHPHNLVLDAWTRLGAVGAAVITAIGALGLGAAIAGLRSGAPYRVVLGAAALAGLTYALAHGLVDNFFFVPDLALSWWVLIGAGQIAGEK